MGKYSTIVLVTCIFVSICLAGCTDDAFNFNDGSNGGNGNQNNNYEVAELCYPDSLIPNMTEDKYTVRFYLMPDENSDYAYQDCCPKVGQIEVQIVDSDEEVLYENTMDVSSISTVYDDLVYRTIYYFYIMMDDLDMPYLSGDVEIRVVYITPQGERHNDLYGWEDINLPYVKVILKGNSFTYEGMNFKITDSKTMAFYNRVDRWEDSTPVFEKVYPSEGKTWLVIYFRAENVGVASQQLPSCKYVKAGDTFYRNLEISSLYYENEIKDPDKRYSSYSDNTGTMDFIDPDEVVTGWDLFEIPMVDSIKYALASFRKTTVKHRGTMWALSEGGPGYVLYLDEFPTFWK